jgi:hypothetical protein
MGTRFNFLRARRSRQPGIRPRFRPRVLFRDMRQSRILSYAGAVLKFPRRRSRKTIQPNK